MTRMPSGADDAKQMVLRPPVLLRAGALLLVLFPLVFTVLLGRDGEGGYWAQATAVACMALVLLVGLVGLSVRLVLTTHEIRLVNWTDEWRLPLASISGVTADDGLSFSTARGNVRSSCAQPSLAGGLPGYRRAQHLRQKCEGFLAAGQCEAIVAADIVHRRRWGLIVLFTLGLVGLWLLYSAAYLLR